MTRVLTEEELRQQAIAEGVCMHSYDPAWPQRFSEEKGRLLRLFPDHIIEVQHIGSTAIPGLQAKPIIDLMAGVGSMEQVLQLVTPLRASEYLYLPDLNENLPERRWLLRHHGGHRTHHLHLVEHGGAEWLRLLRFRDELLRNPELTARYARLKEEMAGRFGQDRDSYTRSKSDFIKAVLDGS